MVEASPVKLPWYECHWATLMISQHWFRYWLGAVTQASTWANVDADLCGQMASLGLNELMVRCHCSRHVRKLFYEPTIVESISPSITTQSIQMIIQSITNLYLLSSILRNDTIQFSLIFWWLHRDICFLCRNSGAICNTLLLICPMWCVLRSLSLFLGYGSCGIIILAICFPIARLITVIFASGQLK